ncbi:MAG: helix-turn-helix transcriptional regulator [Polyangiaceae bacterium]
MMSDSRQLLVRSYAVTHPPNLHLGERVLEDYNQLVYATRGVMTVTTATSQWVVPTHRAVWIPAGTMHSVRMAGRVQLRTLYFKRGLGGRRVPRQCVAVQVSPLLRELIVEAARIGLLHDRPSEEQRLARVILDQLERVPVAPLRLPSPRDERALRAARTIAGLPGRRDVLSVAARRAGASRRTLERLFLAETGMPLGRWRQRARLVAALQLLAKGHAVTQVALEVGYRTPSAFCASFKRELGETPARYFAVH